MDTFCGRFALSSVLVILFFPHVFRVWALRSRRRRRRRRSCGIQRRRRLLSRQYAQNTRQLLHHAPNRALHLSQHAQPFLNTFPRRASQGDELRFAQDVHLLCCLHVRTCVPTGIRVAQTVGQTMNGPREWERQMGRVGLWETWHQRRVEQWDEARTIGPELRLLLMCWLLLVGRTRARCRWQRIITARLRHGHRSRSRRFLEPSKRSCASSFARVDRIGRGRFFTFLFVDLRCRCRCRWSVRLG